MRQLAGVVTTWAYYNTPIKTVSLFSCTADVI